MSSFLTENPALCRLWGVNAALGILTSRAYLERAQQDAQQHGGERGDGHRGALALIVALSRMPTQLMELVAQKASSHRHLTISDVSMLCKIRCLGPHHALPRRVVVDLRGASVRAGGYSVALVLSDTGCVTLRNGSIDLGGPRMSSSSAERARFASLVVKAADGTVLENLKLRDGPGHGILVDGAKAELRNVSVEYLNASGHGHPPPMPTYGLLCINGAEVTLKSCTFACCGAGIGAAGSKIVARSVQIHQNAQWGVNATHGGSLELTRASISGSAIGVACEGSESRLAITGGRIAGCHKYGVAVRGQAHAQIAGLHVARCGVVGIVAAEAGTFLECRGVKVSRCVGDGVQVTHGAAARMMAGDVGSGRVKATVSREHSGRGYLATGLGSSLECYNCVAHSCGTRGVLVASACYTGADRAARGATGRGPGPRGLVRRRTGARGGGGGRGRSSGGAAPRGGGGDVGG
ncbi:unnamed protein product [Pedinophyceae sp. YPF-701]|nr:unnamed protein product [Pedinophyceae sp. YPF-701]